ncbi:hypothetical protein GCM10027034_17900 [Ramlibacter solisilvae]|uniref:hypothetical protein n=1 Tax=Ramlibacter tataouinensis TaxID=94132 RepID=UPI0011AEBB4E|nr:hypothetical protein [Ramlibacter tataouinensis]
MHFRNYLRFAAVLLVAVLCACAGAPFPPRTVLLGEVVGVAELNEIRDGIKSGPARVGPAVWLASACGYEKANVPEGEAVLVRYFYYWHNTAAGVLHYDPKWVTVGQGVQVKKGNLVEVELTPPAAGNSDEHCPRIRTVRGASLEEAQCAYRKNERGGFFAVLNMANPIGGPGSASIYCPNLETSGWTKVQIGPYDAMAWIKTPPQ